MREFFKRWRPKVGCVTLVMACVLSGMWARSKYFEDEFNVTFDGAPYSVFSSYEAVWFCQLRVDATPRPFWDSEFATGNPPRLEIGLRMESDGWHSASYPILTIGMALLSSSLILWKPRKAK